MSYPKFFERPVQMSAFLPAAGKHGKIISFKKCLRHFLNEIIFPCLPAAGGDLE